ncbi:MAG: YkvA family protein [Anaerolineae bacterium]
MLESWKRRARNLRADTHALYLAYRDPRTPWYARLFAALVVGYAFSPVDLIPDFVPVLGYLDDLVLVPLGVLLALKMIPPEVWAESRARAQEAMTADRPVRWAALVVVLTWLLLLALIAAVLWKALVR